jgi:hypothetical protein
MGTEDLKWHSTDHERPSPESGSFRESLERKQGPLVDIVKAYSDDNLKRVEIGILNQSGLTDQSFSWVKDSEQAKIIAGLIEKYLEYPEGMIYDQSKRKEVESAKKKLEKEIAGLLNKAFDEM